MIPAERFIARSSDRDLWLAARKKGVTATAVAKAATPAGFNDVIQSWDAVVEPNAFMDWGTLREPVIALELKNRFGVMPNDWLIRSAEFDWAMATPDALSLDHTMIGEIKTGGKPFTSVPMQHRRQMQWQLFVSGEQARSCVYAYERRLDAGDGFVPDFDIYFEVVERDEKIIAELLDVATRLYEVMK
jgi:hypothetical protein